MAIHPDLKSMLYESLPEMLLVAKYCLEFRKDEKLWNTSGCYGFPAALLLLSIADSIGSYVEGGSVKNHFKVLNNKEYYGMNLSEDELCIFYDAFRNKLSHNSLIPPKVGLLPGDVNGPVLIADENRFWLNLTSFYHITAKAVIAFLNNPGILDQNATLLNVSR